MLGVLQAKPSINRFNGCRVNFSGSLNPVDYEVLGLQVAVATIFGNSFVYIVCP
jgi:hypothetical protein